MTSIRVIFVATILLVAKETSARGAGRAFPMHAENYVIESFQSVNSRIEWDPTNFLVDQSGWYANCKNIRRGYDKIPEVTPEGSTIGVVYDHINGDGVDAESVNVYLKSIIDKWMRSREHEGTIRGADRFGCSVRPGCDGVVTVACLFSPAVYDDYGGDKPDYSGDHPPTPRPTPRPTRPPTRRPRPPKPKPKPTTFRPEPIINPDGQAFTIEQYDLAEYITGNKWDRSHFLENLSGFEISCSMLNSGTWPFTRAISTAKDYDMSVMGLKGEAPNRGSTQVAMETILKGFKAIQAATNVGCSVIPDCMTGRGDLGDEMWVIVTCIYEEY